MASLPTYKLIYFKHLLDIAFKEFFSECNDFFIKEDDKYVLVSNISKTKIRRCFKSIVQKQLDNIITPFDRLEPQYLFVIGACMPKNNILLKYKDNNYIPQKLQKLLDSEYDLKYVLCEDDIYIDIVMFNQICLDIFNSYFKNIHKHDQNVFFIMHNRLDCYMMFKCLKQILGKKNCINEYLAKFKDNAQPIVALNDMLARYVHNKSLLSSDAEFKQAFLEVKQLVDQLLTSS